MQSQSDSTPLIPPPGPQHADPRPGGAGWQQDPRRQQVRPTVHRDICGTAALLRTASPVLRNEPQDDHRSGERMSHLTAKFQLLLLWPCCPDTPGQGSSTNHFSGPVLPPSTPPPFLPPLPPFCTLRWTLQVLYPQVLLPRRQGALFLCQGLQELPLLHQLWLVLERLLQGLPCDHFCLLLKAIGNELIALI